MPEIVKSLFISLIYKNENTDKSQSGVKFNIIYDL